MKKLILLTFGILMTSNMALACGGVTIKGKSGSSYCLSEQEMNWYSASAWCQAQGMDLIDAKAVCGSLTTCDELKLSTAEKEKVVAVAKNSNKHVFGWTKTSSSTSSAYLSFLTSGGELNTAASHNATRTNTFRYHAFCK